MNGDRAYVISTTRFAQHNGLILSSHTLGAANIAQPKVRSNSATRLFGQSLSEKRNRRYSGSTLKTQGCSPVISLNSLKNPLFRSLLVVQFTGTLW